MLPTQRFPAVSTSQRRPFSRSSALHLPGALFVALCQLIVFVPPSPAQHLVHGTVRDAATGQLLPDVLVTVPGSDTRTLSDRQGAYTVELPPGFSSLRWSRVGYMSRSAAIPAGDSLRLDVQLPPSTTLIGEVAVTGERPPITTMPGLGALALSPKKTERLGGAFGDQLRMVQTLPAVTSNNETSPRFNVRGGSGVENLLLLNGVQVLEPYHLKETPTSGISAMSTDLLGNVLFIPGGFTARYGDRLSAVLDMECREGNRSRAAGAAELSLATLGLNLEGPLGPDASALISARTSHSRYVANYLVDADKRDPSFYDLQGLLAADLSQALHAAAFVLVSRDRTSGLADGHYGSTLVSARADLSLSGRTMLHASASSYNDAQTLAWNPARELDGWEVGNNDLSVTLQTAGVTLESELSDVYSLQAGLSRRESIMDERQAESTGLPSFSSTMFRNLRLNLRPVLLSGFVENLVHIGPRLLLNVGLRVDDNSVPRETRWSPRFLAAYRFASGTTLKAAWGLYYQTANDQQLLAAARFSLPPQHMQQAVHYVLGVEQPLRKDLALRVDLYHKQLDDLISYKRLANGEIVYAPRNDSYGAVNGLDIEASFSDQRVFGWINAAFLIAKQNNRFDTLGRRFLPSDQAKTVTLVFEYRLSEHLTANIRALYGSGFAYGDNVPGVIDYRLHYPDYKRADMRFQYSRAFGSVRGMIYLEIMNFFSFQNVQSFSAPGSAIAPPEYNLFLPMVVNVGLKAWF